MYTNEINILEVNSDKLLEIAQKNALLTWGDGSFTNQFPRVIRELTVADGYLTPCTNVPTNIGKNLIQKRIHSKILAYQVLIMLTDDACKVIKRQSNEYTWKDMNGLDE